MSKIEIKLDKSTWFFDPDDLLGQPGGFGAVFKGRGIDEEPIAVKRLHIDATEAANRELRMADALLEATFEHVMPVMDAGLDEESGRYFLVMPVAEFSLQDEIDRRGPLQLGEAISVLSEVAQGLAELPDIAHRDLKPSNVLWHDGAWKIADFGIARFVEESTSVNTLRGALTPPYGAPEQWNLQRADSATDIYALGCIGYTLLTGSPPFAGPSPEDYRLQHLTEAPPALPDSFSSISPLLLSMLRKQQDMRPSIARALRNLEEIDTESRNGEGSPGLEALVQASVHVAHESAEEDARRAEARSRLLRRQELADGAMDLLNQLLDELSSRIQRVAFEAKRMPHPSLLLRIDLGSAMLEVETYGGGQLLPEGLFVNSRWDVITGAIISVSQSQSSKYVWSANLWFTDRGRTGEYRWWEVSYRQHATIPTSLDEPFAMRQIEDADLAASNIMHSFALAATPKPIDDEDFDHFVSRWADLLAKAASGELRRPQTLPLD